MATHFEFDQVLHSRDAAFGVLAGRHINPRTPQAWISPRDSILDSDFRHFRIQVGNLPSSWVHVPGPIISGTHCEVGVLLKSCRKSGVCRG